MTFSREFPVGRFDFGLRCSGLNAQNSVVVDHCASANSLKPAMDVKGSLRTTRHSPGKSITPSASISVRDIARVGWLFGEGGCQRGAGKITSSGIRGGEDK